MLSLTGRRSISRRLIDFVNSQSSPVLTLRITSRSFPGCLRWSPSVDYLVSRRAFGVGPSTRLSATTGSLVCDGITGIVKHNNISRYALIMEGDLVQAKDFIQRAKHLLQADQERERVVLEATEGLLRYREGNAVDGASHYIATILKARELKNEMLLQLAYLHFCYEELRIGHAPPFYSIEEVQKFFNA